MFLVNRYERKRSVEGTALTGFFRRTEMERINRYVALLRFVSLFFSSFLLLLLPLATPPASTK